MRRFFAGFLWGLVIGGIVAWLYQNFFQSTQETLVARPYRIEEERPSDDFTVLRGIGPAFAQRLHQAGIHTYAQLARLSPEEVAERCQVPLWRVQQDDWIGQSATRSS